MLVVALDDVVHLSLRGRKYNLKPSVFSLEFYQPLADMITVGSQRLRIALDDHTRLCVSQFAGGRVCRGVERKHYLCLEVQPDHFGLLLVRCQESTRKFLFQFQFTKQELVDFLAIREARANEEWFRFGSKRLVMYRKDLEFLRNIVLHRADDFLLEAPYPNHFGRNYEPHRIGATTNHTVFHYASSPGPDLSPPPPALLYMNSSPVRNNNQSTRGHRPTAYFHSPRRGSPPAIATELALNPATPAPTPTPPPRVSDHVVASGPAVTYHPDAASDHGQNAPTPVAPGPAVTYHPDAATHLSQNAPTPTPPPRVSDDVVARVPPVTHLPDGACTPSPIRARDEGKGKGKEKGPRQSHTPERAGGGPSTMARRKKRGRMLNVAIHTVESNVSIAMDVVTRNPRRAAVLLLREDPDSVDMVIDLYGDINEMSEESDAEHAGTQFPVAPLTLVATGSPAAPPSRSNTSESLASSQSMATDSSLIDPFERRDLNQYPHYRLSSTVSPPTAPESDTSEGRVLTQHRLTSSIPSSRSTPIPAPRPRGKPTRVLSSSISSESSSKDPNPKPPKRVRILEPSPSLLRTPTSAQSSKRRWRTTGGIGHMSTGGRPPKKASESRHPEPPAKRALDTFLDNAERELASSPIVSPAGRKRQRIEEALESEDENMDLAVPANEVPDAEGVTSDESVPGTPVIDLTEDSSSDESAHRVHDPIPFIDLTLDSSDEEGDAHRPRNPPDVIDLTGDSSDESTRDNSDDTLVNKA